MNLTFEQAQIIANEYLSEISFECNIKLTFSSILEENFGWVFIYQSEEYMKTGNFSNMLVGNAPFAVNRYDGSIYKEFGTSEPVEFYIEKYKKKLSITPLPPHSTS